MISRRGFVTAAAAAIAGIVLMPAMASACRIDNDNKVAEYQIDFWFDCGVACGNYFTDVPSGTSVSRPGKAGKVQTQAPDVLLHEGGLCEAGRVSVGAHGEVGVSVTGDRDTFTWVSKGGNSWTSPISHPADTAVKGSEPCDWRGTP